MEEEKVIFETVNGEEICNEELALARLLEAGILFSNSRKYVGIKFVKDDSEKGFRCEDGEVEPETVVLFVNCNDLFYWGTADAETFTTTDIPELYKMWEKDKRWGSDKWCCKKRNLQPQKPVIEAMKKDGSWEEWLEKLPEPEEL